MEFSEFSLLITHSNFKETSYPRSRFYDVRSAGIPKKIMFPSHRRGDDGAEPGPRSGRAVLGPAAHWVEDLHSLKPRHGGDADRLLSPMPVNVSLMGGTAFCFIRSFNDRVRAPGCRGGNVRMTDVFLLICVFVYHSRGVSFHVCKQMDVT